MNAGRIFASSVIGPLLAAPPTRANSKSNSESWPPKNGVTRSTANGPVGLSTIERWYYKTARSKEGPVDVLKRKIRSDQGTSGSELQAAEMLAAQYRQHPNWSYQLHATTWRRWPSNTRTGPMPSYVSISGS